MPHNVAELQRKHVVLELESIDRMYLNLYQRRLATPGGVASYFRDHLGHRFASTKQAGAMTDEFVRSIMEFIQEEELDLVRFAKGQRKDEVVQERLREFHKSGRTEGVLFVGVAQEKAWVPRTIRKAVGEGGSIPWIVFSTAMVNHYYFYAVDKDFGPFFLKFCSYFPYPAKLCLNGHEYLKQQLTQRGIAFEALDNGLLSCADLPAAQRLANGLSAVKIDAFVRKWLGRLPHPFARKDRLAGYRYDISILQSEFSLTQVWARGVQGRAFFEEVIRENLDLGRPEQVQLIFQRKLQKQTVARGTCRTRVIQAGVQPSRHIYYKHTHVKQYHKEGRALRTETTINNSYDFRVGRRLLNLPALRQIGFGTNRRVLEVEKLSHDCQLGAAAFERLQTPVEVAGQHASALRFGDARVQALLSVLLLFCLQPEGFRNRQLRPLLAQALGLPEEQLKPGRLSYELRRLRLHGLIERVAKSHRYRLTKEGLRTTLFYARVHQRLLRPGLSILQGAPAETPHPLKAKLTQLEALNDAYTEEKLAAA
ncbi:MAG TPA: hypothetical protein VGO11_11220 [Chthoniobacteraceae bacterium]|jgi:hypothetical protein|nr:hypothetical protein [Chthoniobacteraceae bacterium]